MTQQSFLNLKSMTINESKHSCCFINYLPTYINSMLGAHGQVHSGKSLFSSHENRKKDIHSNAELTFVHKYQLSICNIEHFLTCNNHLFAFGKKK